MKRSLIAIACAALLMGANPDLLQSALDPNPTLLSYTASARLSVLLHAGVPVKKTFTGTAYYKRPDQRIVLDNATGALSKYHDMTTKLPTKDEILTDYTQTSQTSDGTVTKFVLTPKKTDSRVRTLTISVDSTSRLIHEVLYSYTNGATLSIAPTFEHVGCCQLPAHEAIRARFPDYSVDGTLDLSSFSSLTTS
jgi:hypothetical protein